MGVRLLALLEVDYIIQQENEEIQQSIAKFPMIGSSLQKKICIFAAETYKQ